MSEESGPRDVIALTRALAEAPGIDASMDFFGPDPVYDARALGLDVEVAQGRAAVREALEGWAGVYEEYEEEAEEVVDLGAGVVFAAIRSRGRLRGSSAPVPLEDSHGFVIVWSGEKVERIAMYAEPDRARAAAERLANERL
jgi:hypothetical protein